MNAIDIFTQEGSSLESGTSLLGGQKDQKNGASLFDSILKSSIELKNGLDVKVENSIPNTTKMVTNSMENIATAIGSNSLLDRLIVEAKEIIAENPVIESQNKNTLEDSSKFIDTLKDSILSEKINSSEKADLKLDLKSETNSEVKEEIKGEIKVQNNSSISLLDKLIVDAKQDILSKDVAQKIQTNLSEKIIENPIVTNELVDEVKEEIKGEIKVQSNSPTSLLDKLIVDAKQDILSKDVAQKTQTNLSEKIIENPIVTNELVDEVKEETKGEIKVQNNSPTSLLDKLIVDAKNKIIEDKNSLKEQQNIQTSRSVEQTVIKDVLITDIVKSDIITDESNNIIKEQVFTKTQEKVIIVNQNPIETTNFLENSNLESIDEKAIVEKPKSLMDALIQNSIKKQEEFTSKNFDLTQIDTKAKEIVSNIYLGEQKNQLNTQLNFNKTEAMKLLKEGASLEDIQKSAKILDLGLDDVNVEQTSSLDELTKKNNLRDLNDRKQILDSLLNEKNIRSVDVRNLITKSVEASTALFENKLNFEEDKLVSVNSPLSFNIQTKIIGARQQMSNMMSDIAKQMYENYKPPVTVFRINLHPEHLGTIAIMMKSEKNSDVSISMSVSSQATLDALIENQSLLRNSLNKTFDENTKFNLDFNSSDRNPDSNQQQKQEEQRNQDEHIDTQTILKLQEENKEIDDKFDYM
ncbi:flagellar hook-length control protein FliK [Aliarcobacter faecis]|uniref:flagellar hook-length control protein FliK n=1 Tax=Aliarcobacter faecis TaxID=1564138 RepID=UPI0004BC6CD0|nr:flagellar hook-length control protein FliK [Aliarcobacter faecis]QKF72597.1 flagellar hook-length control protein FliK [Aliarcobacter faecis]